MVPSYRHPTYPKSMLKLHIPFSSDIWKEPTPFLCMISVRLEALKYKETDETLILDQHLAENVSAEGT